MNRVRANNKNYVFWLGLALCTIYQSYRYPLQVNTEGFSPTYSDTPLIWQAGKFILAFPLIAAAAVRWLSNSARMARSPIIIGTLFLAAYSLIKMIESHDSQYLDICFWMLFALVLALAVDTISIKAIDNYFCILLAYAYGSTLVEVFLYAAFGRLPAMAYPGTYLVRFGGFLDDPNGFAALVFLLMGWGFHRFKGRTRSLILAGLVVCLLLTQSWTAFIFFLATLFLLALIWSFKRPLTAIFATCVFPLLVISLVQWVSNLQRGLLWELLEVKQGSIEGHTFPWSFWISKWTDWAVLGEWQYNPYESWWAAAMINFGIFWLAAYVALIAALLIYLQRSASKAKRESRPVYAGLRFFCNFFAFGSLGLPFALKFPINALFFLFAFLVAFGKLSENDRSPESSRKLEMREAAAKAARE